MVVLCSEVARLFRRDLRRLLAQIEAFPEEWLWMAPVGVTNPAGTLVLHLEGNLREYVGRQLGSIPYSRDRALEFRARGLSKEDLLGRVRGLIETIPPVIEKLPVEQMGWTYPEVVLEEPLSIGGFLLHLNGHLNWHLGQVDLLRRTLTTDGALVAAGL